MDYSDDSSAGSLDPMDVMEDDDEFGVNATLLNDRGPIGSWIFDSHSQRDAKTLGNLSKRFLPSNTFKL